MPDSKFWADPRWCLRDHVLLGTKPGLPAWNACFLIQKKTRIDCNYLLRVLWFQFYRQWIRSGIILREWWVKVWSCLIILLMVVQVSQQLLLKKLIVPFNALWLFCQEFFMRTKPNLLASFPEVYPRTDNQNPVVLCTVLRLLAAVAMPLIPGSASSVWVTYGYLLVAFFLIICKITCSFKDYNKVWLVLDCLSSYWCMDHIYGKTFTIAWP